MRSRRADPSLVLVVVRPVLVRAMGMVRMIVAAMPVTHRAAVRVREEVAGRVLARAMGMVGVVVAALPGAHGAAVGGRVAVGMGVRV